MYEDKERLTMYKVKRQLLWDPQDTSYAENEEADHL